MTAALVDLTRLRTMAADASATRSTGDTLTIGPSLPDATELATLLGSVPVGTVRITRPADLADDDATPARVLALVRECSSIGVRVAWSLSLDGAQLGLLAHLDHLPEPASVTVHGQPSPQLPAWRSTDHFGLFYFRRGPTFVSVVDQRTESSRRLILDDPAQTAVLRRCLDGCDRAEFAGNAAWGEAAARLEELGVLLRLGHHYLTLPVHMRSWPIGAKLLTGTLASAGPKRNDDPGLTES